ncbi:antitoxin DinJ [Alphaproteobacteria bacterium]|nr:antitoxin DinJ [Alphaproteobacteria bacterium]
MAATAFVRARIDETLKNEAAEVLAGMGLTAETLEKSEQGEDVHHAKDAEDLFNQLGI